MKRKDWIRAGALLAAFAVLFWVLCPPAAAAQENSHANTGKQSEDMIATAESQLYYTAPASGAKYNVWFEEAGAACDYAWCQTFLTWCADQAGISTDVIPRESTVSAAISFYETEKRFQKSLSQGGSYTPRRGDIVYYSANGKRSEPTHVGLITAVEDGTLYTIEGNVSNQVLEQQHDLDAAEIIGYACPLYNDLPNVIVPEKPAVTVEATRDQLDTQQISWKAQDMAQGYVLEIWDADTGRCAAYWETKTVSHRVHLNSGSYRVQVTAYNGTSRVKSDLVTFESADTKRTQLPGYLVQEGDGELATRIQWNALFDNTYSGVFNKVITQYVVQISPADGSAGYQIPVTVDETSNALYTVERQLPPGEYSVWVQAYCEDKMVYCLFSEEWRFSIEEQLPANGDVNGDAQVSMADAVEMQRYLLGETSYSLRSWKRSDLSGDGVVNGLDFAALRQALLTALPETPTLQVRPGPPDDVTEFTWDVCQRAVYYTVEVRKRETGEVVFQEETADIRYFHEMGAGNYIAQVTAVRKDGTSVSEQQYFTVSNLITVDPDPVTEITVIPGDANTPTKISWEPALWADSYTYACFTRDIFGETQKNELSISFGAGEIRLNLYSENAAGGYTECGCFVFYVPETMPEGGSQPQVVRSTFS